MDTEKLLKISQIVIALKEKIKCPICLDLVEDSIQLNCSHRFCKDCISQHRSMKNSSCPLCKKPLKRRINYKDHFGDELSKFIGQVCGLIKQNCGCEVEEIRAKNIEKAFTTSTEVNCSYENAHKLQSSNNVEMDAFSKLHSKSQRCYKNNRKQSKQEQAQKILEFQDLDTRDRIIDWLNDTQKKYDILSQTENIKENSEQNVSNRVRSQSLNLGDENLPEKLINRYHSLNEGLHEIDDYTIEEIESEQMVKQVERKVLLDILEEDCLDNLEKLAKKKVTPNKKSAKKKKKVSPSSCGSSGWERIKVVDRSIKKACKIPKKLDINLQTSQISSANKKVSDKARSNEKKKQSKQGTLKDDKENESHNLKVKDTGHQREEPVNSRKSYNLSVLENYFVKNICSVSNMIEKDFALETSKDLCQNRISKGDHPKQVNVLKDILNEEKQNKDDEDDIFSVVTQKSYNHNDVAMFHVSPVKTDITSTDELISKVSSILDSCVTESKSLNGNISLHLSKCFLNLKSYMDQIKTFKVTTSNKETQTDVIHCQSQEVQTSEASQETLKVSQEQNIEQVKIKTPQPIKNSNESVLICSVYTEGANRINRKLTFEDNSDSKKFKRIRKPSTDSDSDGDGPVHKKNCNRFVRDDLTVQFMDSESQGPNEVQQKTNESPNSGDVLDDVSKYLE